MVKRSDTSTAEGQISGLAHIDALTIIDADGNLINTSRTRRLRKINVADRIDSILLKSKPTIDMVNWGTVRHRAAGEWSVTLPVSSRGPSGNFWAWSGDNDARIF